MSQENVSDKRQIAQGIKFGQRPPSLRKSEGDEGSSDEEEAPRSPLKVLAQVEAEPLKMEPKDQGAQSSAPHSTPVKSPRSKRVLPPTGTIESINLDAVPQSVTRLDNTAAKHKLSVKPKNQRISRKHRRFTLDLQEVSIPGVMQEELEAADQRRASLESSKESLKKQRFYEEEMLEARRTRELEEQQFREEMEERKKRAEELRMRDLEEERSRKKQQEEQEKRMREEAERRRREEEEQRRVREEEEKRKQEEAERQREEEDRRMKEEEERRRREEAERRKREEEDRKMREEAERLRREEEERRIREEEERRKQEERRRREEEDRRRLEEQKQMEEDERKRREEDEKKRREEEAARRQCELEAEKRKKQEAERKKKEEKKVRPRETEQRKQLEQEEQKKMLTEEGADEQERKRRAEEQRWREMEERQRPFSFKVSSGEKQILFQKVNLTPVTPAASHQGTADADQRVTASSQEGRDSPNLPASPYVPHTAILVTGAQLCGTAVNLDQIKDTACKSLLGLGEERKAQGTSSATGKSSPDRKSGKSKSVSEYSVSPDQSGAAVLAEWASIRSKIFKGVEDGKYDEYPDPPSRNQPQPGGDEQPPFAHTNLRKTMSASAKFSITPAKKKFGDSNRSSEVFSADHKDGGGEEAVPSDSPTAASQSPTVKPHTRTSKTVRIAERGSEECMFAKDLPSFLVPSPGDKPEGSEVKSRLQSKTEEGETQGQDGEDNPSPFGIKLRRTNYSLRFHSEQSTEKRKKRYSAGDSFDGVPSPLTPIEPDSDASSVFSDKSSPASPQKEGVVSKYLHASASPAITRGKLGKPTSPVPHDEGEKVLSKPPLYRRPTTSPKPSGAAPTPPPSPLPKVAHGFPCEEAIQRTGSPDLSVQEQASRSEDPSAVTQLHRGSHGNVHLEEEPKEKKSFFPSINIPWREKADRKAELIRREKPSLQTRHSLDSARVQEKEAGPLWITLALQKQKGFREQQQTREDRRSQREAKLAEKHAREKDGVALVSPTDGRESRGTSPSSKPQTPEEPKRPDSLLGRFERRDPLKKASTLPSSVTVEISDSTPSPPAVKDVSKRFPSSDSPQVSTEPAWLALAKRKAKAWSDCPQIIK
ncbi:capping protein inhibiting regulator of actin dynamics isoform X1 [Poeciliopsis prolifica]|uniref:capping protein inhibiting regulator of actin dynamics isoform X1 n=1 Tax=Poeciliopsis prolifica TaxID=188132 RepID=UPI0024130224|nr:capping protein inhibiting regulator of actin dynamics isoform X1 [Poeciliopsis prolifica]